MKLFNTNHLQTITECQSYFGFQLSTVMLSERSKRFEAKRRPNSRRPTGTCLLCWHCFLNELSSVLLLYIALLMLLLLFSFLFYLSLIDEIKTFKKDCGLSIDLVQITNNSELCGNSKHVHCISTACILYSKYYIIPL